MHRRYDRINVPTEIVRTLVVIAETGSFSKAGERLNLSQPAISAQMNRLQVLTGGPVFERTAGGVTLTSRGGLVLAQARKLLEANDQMLMLGGGAQDSQPLRLGLSTLYADEFFADWSPQQQGAPINFYCDVSMELAKGLQDSYIDIALMMHPPVEAGVLVMEWHEEFVWARSKNFVLSPGAAVPLVTWPGSHSDIHLVQALEKAGMAYRVVFASSDHHARLTATAAGIGLMGLPRRKVLGPLIVAKEHYLPTLEPQNVVIAIRPGLEREGLVSNVSVCRSWRQATFECERAPRSDSVAACARHQ